MTECEEKNAIFEFKDKMRSLFNSFSLLIFSSIILDIEGALKETDDILKFYGISSPCSSDLIGEAAALEAQEEMGEHVELESHEEE